MKKTGLIVAFILIGFLHVLAQPGIGTTAPDIALPDANGTRIRLSDLEGKAVLVDFWASWCQPCRVSNRGMQSVYKKYHDKGFEIFGVSLDDKTAPWLRAIRQDKITWLQVIDTKASMGNEMALTWNLRYIPATFLIDKEGKIVFVNPLKSELEKWLKNNL